MKTSVRKPSTREIGTVFAYWNRKKIVKHRVLTDRIRRKISGQLKYYTVAELCESIFNYSEVLLDDGCYWTYRWTLHDFLQRGVEKFMSEAVPFENFKVTYPISKPKPKVENKEYSNRFGEWKRASPEERIILEQKWRDK